MLAQPGRSACLVFALVAAGSMASDALGQGNTFNPYGNSGYRDYREFTQPMYSNEPSLPGQARLQREGAGTGGSRANQFDAFTESLEGREAESKGSSTIRRTPGVPYYRSYRKFDEEYNRVYTPNAKADEKFADRLKERTSAYDRAMEEKDPAKRAVLLRKLNQNSLDRPAQPPTRNTAKGAVAAKSGRAATPSAIPQPPVRRSQDRTDTTKPALRARDNTATSPRAATPSRAAAPPATTTPAATQPAAATPAPTDPSSVVTPPPR